LERLLNRSLSTIVGYAVGVPLLGLVIRWLFG
jgi:hypothetical protein